MIKKTNRNGKKPYKDFPLTYVSNGHGGGRWKKKIRGVIYYFGTDADEALDVYLAERDHLQAGKTRDEARALVARANGDQAERVTIDEMVNRFLADKSDAVDAGRLEVRTLGDYFTTARLLISVWGRSTIVDELTPADFAKLQKKLHQGRALATVKNLITRIKVIFNHAFTTDLIDRPMKFGREFSVTQSQVNRAKVDDPKYFFSAPELRKILKKANPRMRAMILLGINSGMGNLDVALIRERHIDFESGWVNYPRRKTGQPRSFPLWPETAAALREVIKARPVAKNPDDFDCVFIGRNRNVLVGSKNNYQINRLFRALLDRVGSFPSGAGFYTLRRTFCTVARQTGRSLCVKYIAGHRLADITDGYDETLQNAAEVLDPAGLVEVVLHVRQWLLENNGKATAALPSLLNIETAI